MDILESKAKKDLTLGKPSRKGEKLEPLVDDNLTIKTGATLSLPSLYASVLISICLF